MGNTANEAQEQVPEENSSVQTTVNQSDSDAQVLFNNGQETPDTSTDLSVEALVDTILPPPLPRFPAQSRLEPDWDMSANVLAGPGTDSNTFACLDPRFMLDDDLGGVMMTDLWQMPAPVRT